MDAGTAHRGAAPDPRGSAASCAPFRRSSTPAPPGLRASSVPSTPWVATAGNS